MNIKRMRVFAGPNGSGKTTIINDLRAKDLFRFGVYVNADDIEKIIRNTNILNLSGYDVKCTSKEIRNYFKKSKLSPVKLNDPYIWKMIKIEGDVIILKVLKI